MNACRAWSRDNCPHRNAANLWSNRGSQKLLKGKVTEKTNPFGLPVFCSRTADLTTVVLLRLHQFYDPLDGDGCIPTVVLATRICVGRNAASLLQHVRDRNGPTVKSDVFSRALTFFGSAGPVTCHPFARKYHILHAVFSKYSPHPTADPSTGLQQACFTVSNLNNTDISAATTAGSRARRTSATLNDSRGLPVNVCEGDVFRMEVQSSSPRHAVLQIPPDVGFLDESKHDNVIILNVSALGFVDSYTNKFRARPQAAEFILQMNRIFTIATVADRRGDTIKCGLFNMYSVLFSSEEEDLYTHIQTHHLDDTNAFILDTIGRDSDADIIIPYIYVSSYTKNNKKDTVLDISSDMCVFLKSIYDKSNIGLHIGLLSNK